MIDPTDRAPKKKVMTKEWARKWARKWANQSLRQRARDLRKLSTRARNAYTKDPMYSACMILAKAYADAADLIGSRIINR